MGLSKFNNLKVVKTEIDGKEYILVADENRNLNFQL